MNVKPGSSGYLREYGVELKLIQTTDDVAEFMRWLGERRDTLGVDTETTGLSPERDTIRLSQFGDMKTGWAIPHERWGGVVYETLNKYQGTLVLQNAKFDIRHFLNDEPGFVWPWHRTYDTMLMAALEDPLQPKGLKPLAAKKIDPAAIAAQRSLDNGMHQHKWTWATVPLDFEPYWVYAALDPVLTCHLADDMKDVIKTPQFDLEMATLRIIAGMEQQGMRVDPDYLQRTRQELVNSAQDKRIKLVEEYGVNNPTPLQLIKYFKGENVPMLDKLTNSGSQAMDKEVLASIDHPVARLVEDIRKEEKLITTYIDNLYNFRDENDRVHPNVWTMGARTGRMSITDPALQTLPKRDLTIRSAFIPDDGKSLISFDMDQVEARLAAFFSGSPELMKGFTGEEDFFCMVASTLYNKPITKKDSERQRTKGYVYGSIYGGGLETLAATTGVSVDEMAHVSALFNHNYPELKQLSKTLEATAAQRFKESGRAFIRTPTGREIAAEPDRLYALTNYLIQGHAAEILKMKLVELDSALPDYCQLLLPIHDEILMEAPTELVPELMPFIQEVLDDFDTYPVPITWGGESSNISWGDLASKG